MDGQWMSYKRLASVKCSKCNKCSPFEFPYCPFCGSKMENLKDNEKETDNGNKN